jgi:hypothetical protein
LTELEIERFANRNGFTIRITRGYHGVRSKGSKAYAFIGSLRECYVWLLGYTWNRGAA